jgi:hypothetical protein
VFETRDYMYTRLDKQARDFEQGTTPTTIAPAATPGAEMMPPQGMGGGDELGDEDDGGGEDEE